MWKQYYNEYDLKQRAEDIFLDIPIIPVHPEVSQIG